MKLLKSYYSALKPERAYANVMTTGAGYLFASKWHVHWITLLATLLGTTFVVMSACAVNNCTDRELDRRMPRTKHRPSATGRIPITHLVFLAVVLGVTGFIVLIVKVNVITVVLGILGYIDYVVFYAWTKRKTVWEHAHWNDIRFRPHNGRLYSSHRITYGHCVPTRPEPCCFGKCRTSTPVAYSESMTTG